MACDLVQIMGIAPMEEELPFAMFLQNFFGIEAGCQAVFVSFDSWFTGKLLLQSVSGLGQLLFH